MREIRPSGSEGGAVMSRPYPYRWTAGTITQIRGLGADPAPHA